jgi:ribosomal protein S18 acetylase RimI-like enzyme
VRLRPATVDDVDDLLMVESAVFGVDGWAGAAVLHELTTTWRYVVVAQDAGSLVGWAVLLESDVCDVLRVAVTPVARRRGVGRALLDALVTRAGTRAVLLEVAADNAAAHALYAAAGFVEIDRRLGYYGSGRDALVLSRTPDDPVYGVPRA